MEKVSILVPCYNVEKYLPECLDSIKAQSYSNLEIICIDDGSTDKTGDIIDEYVKADSRFNVIHKPNTGYGDSMNIGLDTCTGEYIGIVESDDWIEPNMFEVLLTAAKENNLDLVRCCWFEGSTGTEREEHQDWVKKDNICVPLENRSVLMQQPSIWVSLYRRDLLEEGRKVRFLPTPGASYQDTSFAFKAYTKSKRFMMLDIPLYHYRINPNSSVSSTGKAYCILDEWEEMRRWVSEEESLRNKFAGSTTFGEIWQGGMLWNYNRLSNTALKLLFLRRASLFFQKVVAEDLLNVNSDNIKVIKKVMKSPLDFHYDIITKRLNELPIYKSKRNALCQKKNQDLVSVVVTCYNTSKYIYSSLQSITQQSYDNIEIICVDDCSTDDTKTIVHHIMRKDKRISWYSTNKNSGLSASRNVGIQHCHGKYVAFVDGDDCLLPDAIATLYNSMTDEDDVIVGSIIVTYEDGEIHYGALVESDKNYYTIKQEQRINALKEVDSACNIHVSACGKLWRTSIIRENNLCFPEGLLYEDACFFWQYLCVAPRLHAIKAPVYLYQRHRSGSIMNSTFEKQAGMAIQHILILDVIYKFACDKHLERGIQNLLSRLYEPFFWFAYNNSPQSDLDAIYKNMCRILKEQDVDLSISPLLSWVAQYEETSKDKLFMDAYNGNKPTQVEMSPAIYRLNKKLKKYRKLTKLFAIISIVLLLALIVTLIIL